jgi:hypothetical protein
VWSSSLASLDEFRTAIQDPDLVFVSGYLNGAARSLSVASLSEELDSFFVVGNDGWRAQVYRDGRRLRTLQASAVPRGRSPAYRRHKAKEKLTWYLSKALGKNRS